MKPVLFFLILLILFSCASEKKDPEQIKNGDVNIVWNKSGNGDTAIVFVHGWCINKEYWAKQQEYFSKQYTTVAIDLGGHGQSGRNRSTWTMEEYANDVAAVIKGLKLKNVILVGHSMGGDIILHTAEKLNQDIAGFVGIDNLKEIVTSFNAEQQKGNADFINQLKTNYDTMAAVMSKQFLFPPGYADTVPVNRVTNNILAADRTIAVSTLEDLIKTTLKEGELLAKLKVPVTLIASDFGPVNKESLLPWCKKGLNIKTIKGVGHYPMIEKPDEFNAVLQEVINGMKQNN